MCCHQAPSDQEPAGDLWNSFGFFFSKASLTKGWPSVRTGPCLQLDMGERKNTGDDSGKTSGLTCLGAACLPCLGGQGLLVSYCCSRGLCWSPSQAGSLSQAAARLAGDDPSVRQRWKSPLHPSSVQLGRHFQRSAVQPVSENGTALMLQPP